MLRERVGTRPLPRATDDTPSRRPRSVRRTVRSLHRVLGLIAAAGLLVSGLTGSALVFRSEIDTALNPHLLRVAPTETRASLQSVVDEVRREYPGDTLSRLRMPQRRDGTYELWLGASPSRYVYADPYSGTLLGTRRPTEFLTGWLFLLHSQLLGGEVGRRVVGTGALCLVLLSMTGLVAWWPRRAPWRAWAQWRAALTVVRNHGATRTLYDLHRAIGFYASVLLFAGGLTGASLIFTKTFERAAYLVTFSRPPRVVEPAPAAPVGRQLVARRPAALPLDSLLAIAERAQPGGAISYLYFPSAASQRFGIRKRLPGEKHPNGKSFVYLEPSNGRVLAVEDGVRAPLGARLYSILYPIHIGILGGMLTRLLAVIVGLTLATLAITGVSMWWRRGWRRGW